MRSPANRRTSPTWCGSSQVRTARRCAARCCASTAPWRSAPERGGRAHVTDPSRNVYLDNPDLRWQIEHGTDWERLVPVVENDFRAPDAPASVEEARELYAAVLEEAGRIVAREILPYAHELDTDTPRLEDGEVRYPPRYERILAQLAGADLLGLPVPRELGGMGLPLVVNFAVAELLARADVGLMTRYGFHGGIAIALLLYAALEGSATVREGRIVDTRFREAIEACARGDAWGAMVLTEPDAGSDLAAIRTEARCDEHGRWRLRGEKIFITCGDGEHHLVLARSEPDRPGLDGLSLFYVPRHRTEDGARVRNVEITKLEHKLGHHSSPTVSLLYDDAHAELIGARGEGFRLMLRLMNGARIAVGFEGIGLCEAAYRQALRYASERRSMGRLLREHELIADMLESMDTGIRAMRALAFEAATHVELEQRLTLRLRLEPPSQPAERAALEAQLAHHARRGRDLTPLLKYVASERAVHYSRLNMQIHGGMGYMTETGADKLLRDALVLPIYEGTSQIQALMALKDRLGGVLRDPLGFVRAGVQARLRARTRGGLEASLWEAERIAAAAIEHVLWRILGAKLRRSWSGRLDAKGLLERFEARFRRLWSDWDARRDFAFGLLHAERLTRILADLETARVLVRQARRAPEREELAERFLRRALPRMRAELGHVTSTELDPERIVAALTPASPTNHDRQESPA
ncbi:MAG: hypothetical protein D6776_10875 [Planctomycetota bacterium]|nr:MAG: hypothetical protein D6776_10875 [Planctomycetota bacterium]